MDLSIYIHIIQHVKNEENFSLSICHVDYVHKRKLVTILAYILLLVYKLIQNTNKLQFLSLFIPTRLSKQIIAFTLFKRFY